MEKVEPLVLDKTGTLTEGKPRVTRVLAMGGIGEAELLRLVATLERASEHPLAAAVLAEAPSGAVRALSDGKSLLPAGVTAIDGEFRRGDVVNVKDRRGKVLARGLVAYAAEDARRIAGRKSVEIEKLLGFRGRDEMVHRDDLVVE